jgi:hypothetical protein
MQNLTHDVYYAKFVSHLTEALGFDLVVAADETMMSYHSYGPP